MVLEPGRVLAPCRGGRGNSKSSAPVQQKAGSSNKVSLQVKWAGPPCAAPPPQLGRRAGSHVTPSSLCSVLTTDLSGESLWGEGSGRGSGRVITCTPPPRCSERARLRTDSCLCLRTLRRWTPSCGTLRTKDRTVSFCLLNQEHQLLINDFI